MRGFTLLELSIVLVIIGLIVGGISVGSRLIESSRVKSTASQLADLNASIYNFLDLYRQMPGDFRQASLMISGALDGNGNGKVCVDHTNPCITPTTIDEVTAGQTNELMGVFNHLSQAELTEGSFNGSQAATIIGRNVPKLKIGERGILGYTDSNENAFIWYLGIADTTTATIDGVPAFTPKQAFELDNILDDGLPGFGSLREVGNNIAFAASPQVLPGEFRCHTGTSISWGDSSVLYDVSKAQIECAMGYKLE